MDNMNREKVIRCPSCDRKLQIPQTEKTLIVTCPNCGSVFSNNPPRRSRHKNNWLVLSLSIIAIIVVFIMLNKIPADQAAGSSNWVTISYGELVNKSIFTHSGESVGEIIRRIPQYDDELKGLVQPYLEPYSILCHDVLLSSKEPDTLPLVNIFAHYPIGSEQPAWVALFREGHYQLYYNAHLIRVFIEGADVTSALEQHCSVIRHAVRDVINSDHVSIENIEVYVFKNDYAATEIQLNTIPATFPVNEFDLSPRHKSIDLSSIEDFLKQGVILEAVEVDANNDLYFYGKQASGQTLAGLPVSISDIATIYRSVFHYGYNAPYISLDKHEDNRYAKVNFGGHLENTHAGHVVLEADKLFKTLSTGLDPNTHELVKFNITRHAPDFLTEDERHFLEPLGEGHIQLRYWFYPDSIGTVTDGSIGVVLTHQFLADVERMDTVVRVGNAVRETIDHLNRNFGQYENAYITFKELSTVGRIMALMNWLEGMDMNDRLELDDFLSVRIPAFTTPKKTKKMLAVTVIAYPEHSRLTTRKVRDDSKVYYMSHLLDKYSSSTTDEQFIEIANDHLSQIDYSDIAPLRYNELQSTISYYDRLLESNEARIVSLEKRIDQSDHTLDIYDSHAVDRHNELVNEYNGLLETQQSCIDAYNSLINEQNDMNILDRAFVSIGGGINLRPSEFKRILRNTKSPKIQEVTKIKGKIKTVGKVSKSGDWVRSNAQGGGARINKISTNSWISSKSVDGSVKYSYRSNAGDIATVTLYPLEAGWQSSISVNGCRDMVKLSKEENLLTVKHADFGEEFTGVVSADGKRIEFNK